MPSVYQLKPRFQALLRPAMRAFARAGVTPNGLTLLATAGSLAVGAAMVLLAGRPRARPEPAREELVPAADRLNAVVSARRA